MVRIGKNGHFLSLSWLSYYPVIFLILFPLLSFSAPKKEGPLAALLPGQTAAPTIVLDAGHGGRDRGAKAKVPFCEEKRLCLQTARLVKKYLDQLGYRVIMTRSTDAFLPLARRVEIAHQAHCEAFVSIHFNASRNPSAQGVEIFFHDSKEDRSRSRSSKRLAELILPRIQRRTSAISRGVKKGNFYVIRETKVPAILVEGGFITHPKERLFLKNPTYQEKLARGIADGIDTYFRKMKRV